MRLLTTSEQMERRRVQIAKQMRDLAKKDDEHSKQLRRDLMAEVREINAKLQKARLAQ